MKYIKEFSIENYDHYASRFPPGICGLCSGILYGYARGHFLGISNVPENFYLEYLAFPRIESNVFLDLFDNTDILLSISAAETVDACIVRCFPIIVFIECVCTLREIGLQNQLSQQQSVPVSQCLS